MYTVSGSSTGNKALTYPIGLINSSEAIFARTSGTNYYLYNEETFWTMTPVVAPTQYFTNYRVGQVGLVCSDGYTGNWGRCSSLNLATWGLIDNLFGIRPVINLQADIEVTGTGSQDNPFKAVGAN